MGDNMDLEETIMEIIINSGASRSLCYEALRCAKNNDFTEAEQKLEEANTYMKHAHQVQTRLIEQDEGKGKIPMTLIMVHAQDHMMNAILAKEIVTELIYLHQLRS